MIRELKQNWGGWLCILFMFVIAPGVAIWDQHEHPHPQVAQQWTLDDGSVCRRFQGTNSITCTH